MRIKKLRRAERDLRYLVKSFAKKKLDAKRASKRSYGRGKSGTSRVVVGAAPRGSTGILVITLI